MNPKYTEARYNLAASSFGITTNDGALISQTRKAEQLKEFRRFPFQGNRADFFPVPNEELDEESEGAAKDEGGEEGEELSEEAKQQMLDGFIKKLKGDVEATASSWESLFNLGLFYDINDMGKLAVQNYRQAMEKDPEHRMSRNNLAVALIVHENDLAEGESLLLQNLAAHRYDRTTVLNLALVNRKKEKSFQTLRFFTYVGDLLAKSLDQFETEKAEEHARELFEKRKYYDAIPIFENMAVEKQEDYWLEKLAVMYLNQKNEDKYLLTFKRLLRINPQHQEARAKLTEYANNYEAEGREKIEKGSRYQAIEFFLKAVKVEETPERWLELAQLYQDEGEEILADNALRRWKKLTGEESEATQEQQQATAS